MASLSPSSGRARHHAERLSVCAGLPRAKNPRLVEQDFTRIKSEYYPALREGGSLIIVNTIFTAVGVMARCKDDPDLRCIDSPIIKNGRWDEERRRFVEGHLAWPGRGFSKGECMDEKTAKNGHHHQFTMKPSKCLKTLTFRKEGGVECLQLLAKSMLQSFWKLVAFFFQEEEGHTCPLLAFLSASVIKSPAHKGIDSFGLVLIVL